LKSRLLLFLSLIRLVQAQDIDLRLYSEFQRVKPDGSVVDADRAEFPQEPISPPLIRNGYTTFHFSVTGRPRILYWIAIQTNPGDLFQVRVYREMFSKEGVPDALHEEPKPYFFLGVMPDSQAERVTQEYLLDIWTPPDTPADRVRFEVLVKTGDWVVAPMEVRVLTARVPRHDEGKCCGTLPNPEAPIDRAAWAPVWSVLSGYSPPRPPVPGTLRSIILRNALQDAALTLQFDSKTRAALLDRITALMVARQVGGPASLRGDAESYLAIRRRIWNLANDLATGAGNPVQ
jgi:hypothetical protein